MSFARYPAYKDSGVAWLGEVPGHWEVKRLKLIASHNDETLDESTDADFEILYVDISSVDPMLGITAKEAMLFSAAPSRARRKVRNGDAIVSTVRTYLRAIARITNPEDNLIVSTGFAVVRPSPQVHHSFLGYLLTAGFFVDEVIARSVGVSYPAINASDLMRIAVPLPKYNEQQAIATFLDIETAKIDGLMAEQRALVALLTEKRQAVISHAVTKGLNPAAPMKDSGVAWLGKVPGHWEVKRIKHLTASFEQGWSPQCEGFPVESENEWGVLKVGCVNGGIFRPEENKTLPDELEPIPALGISSGDLLISRANTRELVGSTAVATRDYPNLLLCDKLYRVRFHIGVCEPMFIGLYLGTNLARSQIELAANGASSSMVNIGQSIILEMQLALPSIAEQNAIVEFLNHQTTQLDTLTQQAQTAIALLQERRTALISAAVTGKMDVRAA